MYMYLTNTSYIYYTYTYTYTPSFAHIFLLFLLPFTRFGHISNTRLILILQCNVNNKSNSVVFTGAERRDSTTMYRSTTYYVLHVCSSVWTRVTWYLWYTCMYPFWAWENYICIRVCRPMLFPSIVITFTYTMCMYLLIFTLWAASRSHSRSRSRSRSREVHYHDTTIQYYTTLEH